MEKMKYQEIYSSESFGSSGSFGIKILVSSSNISEIQKMFEIKEVLYEAVGKISAEVMAAEMKYLPQYSIQQERNRELIQLFKQPIYVDEIPNGYCKDWCCRHLPWFVVTTTRGRFKIGWRKRVIHIGWGETDIPKDASLIFPNEEVTKGEGYMHAHCSGDAGRYIEKLMSLQAEK